MSYDKNVIIEKNLFQSKTYINLALVLDTIKPILEKFDNKIINIKLDRAIKEILPTNYYISLTNTYGNKKRISLFCNDRCFKLNNNWIYIDDNKCSIDIEIDRLNYNNSLIEIDKEILRLNNHANTLKNAIDDINNTEIEYNNICKMIKEFNNKVPYEIRDFFKFDRVY